MATANRGNEGSSLPAVSLDSLQQMWLERLKQSKANSADNLSSNSTPRDVVVVDDDERQPPARAAVALAASTRVTTPAVSDDIVCTFFTNANIDNETATFWKVLVRSAKSLNFQYDPVQACYVFIEISSSDESFISDTLADRTIHQFVSAMWI